MSAVVFRKLYRRVTIKRSVFKADFSNFPD